MANFNEMSEQQREEYYQKVCKAIGLDPDLLLLEYIWMPSENGFKNLVLYCRRGAAEILRAARGVSVTKMTRAESSDSVSYIVEGADKTGRTEIAVGSHTLDGLKGDRKAHAEMTASTRGLRRLTLQFVGHGLLDESEVTAAQLNSVVVSPAPDVQLASTSIVFPPNPMLQMPKLSPNPEPGKQINTTVTDAMPLLTKPSMQEMRDEAARQLAAKASAVSPAAHVSASVETHQNSETPDQANTGPEPKKVRKPRGPNKKRNTVDMSSPGQVSVAIPVEAQAVLSDPRATPVQQSVAHATAVVTPDPQHAPALGIIGLGGGTGADLSQVGGITTIVSQPATPVDFPGKPTKEQEEGYRVFLREYANNVLPMAGMRPSEGIGGASAKLRLFAEKQSGKPTARMTVDDWEEFKAFFPDFLSRNSPQNLVKYINDVIGAK